jgi:serine/threonine protein kinase/thiol-disulfide isomerase/thioredoxin
MLPQYEITALLGRGGMGAVYKGMQKNLDRPVAIKILPPGMDDEDRSVQFTERFKNEARSMARLSHPGIVKVFDFGETADGLFYIVMEFIEGTDVAQMLKQQERLPPEHAYAITAHVCDALAYAHDRGIIHRDIKPANIMVGQDGVVKVTDFGLAKMDKAGESGLTRSGMALGTLHYIAPEALMLGTAVDHRADLYAVGVMLYQMLTGRLPQGIFRMPSQIVPGLDDRYDGIVARAMREDRALRHQSAAELRTELDTLLTRPIAKVEAPNPAPAALPTQQRPQGRPYRPQTVPQPHLRPQKSSSNLTAWMALAAIVAAGAYFWQMPPQATADPIEEATATVEPPAPVSQPTASSQIDRLISSAPQAATVPLAKPQALQPPASTSTDVIGRFTFDGQTPDPGAQIRNATQQNGVLHLSGDYENRTPPGYRAVFSTPDLDYNRFTVAARLYPEREKDVLLVGGTGYRWLSLKWLSATSLTLFMNNQRFNHTISGVDIPLKQWVTLAVSCDLSAKQVVVYVNGKNAARVTLPDDFKLEVIGSRAEKSDKVWTPTNYSNGTAFKGLLDELVVYNRVLSDQEIATLRLGGAMQAAEQALMVDSVIPDSPARLKFGERLTVKVSYNNTSSDSVQIWARPYTQGKMTSGYSAHGSSGYPRGKGQIEGWFTFQKATAVDEVRVQMVDVKSKQVVANASFFLQASWSGEGGNAPVRAASSSPARSAPTSNVQPGQEVALKFTAVDGREVDLASLKGKVVLIDFWATWCGPCVAGIPDLVSAYQKYHDQGFEIIGISLDSDKAALERMTKERGMTWPQYFDGKGWQNAFGTQFGIRAVPTLWLVGRDGKIASTNARADLAGQVVGLLGLTPAATAPAMPAASSAPLVGPVTLPARRSVVTPQLATIPFPTTADASAWSDYVLALLAYNPWQNNQSDKTGVQERLALLQDVAERNFGLVLQTLERTGSRIDVTSREAIVSVALQHANDQNQTAIFRAFEKCTPLAAVIAEKNWIQKSAPSMAAALRGYPYLSSYSSHETGFFGVCFQSEDAAVWQELENLFSKTNFSVAHSVYVSGLRKMPTDAQTRAEARLARLIPLMLGAARQADPTGVSTAYRILYCSEEAARIGHADALQALALYLTTGSPQVRSENRASTQKRVSTTVQTLTGCPTTLSPPETGRWVLERLTSLRWDTGRKQFLVP